MIRRLRLEKRSYKREGKEDWKKIVKDFLSGVKNLSSHIEYSFNGEKTIYVKNLDPDTRSWMEDFRGFIEEINSILVSNSLPTLEFYDENTNGGKIYSYTFKLEK